MEKHEVPFGGVYRLTVDGQLVGEFVPDPSGPRSIRQLRPLMTT